MNFNVRYTPSTVIGNINLVAWDLPAKKIMVLPGSVLSA